MSSAAHETHMDPDDLASNLRSAVWEIRDLYKELPDTIAAIAGLHGTRYDRGVGGKSTNEATVIGGDALVLVGPGNDNNVTSSKLGNRDHAADILANDPPSVLAVLTRIEDTWRHDQGQPAADTTTLSGAVNYLIANAPWAGQHSPTAQDDLVDLHALRGRLRACTGHNSTPKPSDAPCGSCNGVVVQRYTSEGLDDIRECNRCGATYTPAQYAIAMAAQLESARSDPERTLTASEARTLWGLSEKQVYVWEQREKIAHIGVSRAGLRLYRNGDIAALRGR